ncbi:MAG TPA: fatty acid desaturase [Candidatus Gracilibacteria bacterium]
MFEKLSDWLQLCRPFRKASYAKSTWQIINSFGGFFLSWVAAYFALKISFFLALPFIVLIAGFAIRIFIIQHDCGHGSFFPNRKANDRLGFWCGLLTLAPYKHWKWTHATHHAHAGDLDFRGIGDVETLTVHEYLGLSRIRRFGYRFMRNPIMLFLVVPPILFLVGQRVPHKKCWKQKDMLWSVWDTNLALLTLWCWVAYLIGWQAFFIIQLTSVYVNTVVGVWLFYVQHQFEDAYWQENAAWDPAKAAMEGSSFFRLPKVLQWFTGNIGFHHVHHLDPMIPNYELEKCHKSHPAFTQVTTLTLANCWATMKLRFWDEKLKRMLSVKEMKSVYYARNKILKIIYQVMSKV